MHGKGKGKGKERGRNINLELGTVGKDFKRKNEKEEWIVCFETY